MDKRQKATVLKKKEKKGGFNSQTNEQQLTCEIIKVPTQDCNKINTF